MVAISLKLCHINKQTLLLSHCRQGLLSYFQLLMVAWNSTIIVRAMWCMWPTMIGCYIVLWWVQKEATCSSSDTPFRLQTIKKRFTVAVTVAKGNAPSPLNMQNHWKEKQILVACDKQCSVVFWISPCPYKKSKANHMGDAAKTISNPSNYRCQIHSL